MYEIKILNSKDFDKLPYRGIEDSLGLADVKKNRVFVRDTGVHELNRYLINHEIDHLVEEHATDEDAYGIRHKKGPKLFKDIFLPFISAGLSGDKAGMAGSALGGLSDLFYGKEAPQTSGSYTPQQQQPTSGSYSPSGGFGSPLNLFPTSGSYSPATVPGSISGGNIENGAGAKNSEIPPEILQQLKSGYYSGGGIKF